MSYFGQLVAEANEITDDTFAEHYNFTPMREVLNSKPEPDPDRQGGVVFVIMLKPGMEMMKGGMHIRATAQTTMFYMARGLLSDVRQFDRFELVTATYSNLDARFRYEVADGPIPIGFGRWKATMIELPLVEPPPSSRMQGDTPWGDSP